MTDSFLQELGLVEPKGTKVDAQVDPYFTSQCREDDVVNGGKTSFGSYPKEGYKSNLKSPFGIYNEAEDKDTSVGCKPKDLVEDQATIATPHKEKNMMQRDEHSSNFCIPLYHDEVTVTPKERLDMSEKRHITIIIEESHEPPILISGKT